MRPVYLLLLLAIPALADWPIWQHTIPSKGFVKSDSVVLEDAVMISPVNGLAGYFYDIFRGKELGDDRGIPRSRSCTKIIDNSSTSGLHQYRPEPVTASWQNELRAIALPKKSPPRKSKTSSRSLNLRPDTFIDAKPEVGDVGIFLPRKVESCGFAIPALPQAKQQASFTPAKL
jgi:hypothetical protein